MSIGPALAVTLAALSGIRAVVAQVIAAEQPSAEQIIKALKPPQITRGLTAPPAEPLAPPSSRASSRALRNRATRSLSTDEREKIDEIAKSRPSIDLEINFEYNSAIISPKAIAAGERARPGARQRRL